MKNTNTNKKESKMYKINDVVKIHSGMGGSFNVRLVFFHKETGKWQGIIEMPLNKEWDKSIIWFIESMIISF